MARINGKRVGDELLNPACSAYDRRVYYNALDASPYLVQGENRIEVTLGNGWFNQQEPDAWFFEQATWCARPRLICELFVDGKLALASGSDWLCGLSRTTYNSLRCGETFDAAQEPTDFHPASIARGPGGFLQRQTLPPIRLRETISPVKTVPAQDGGVIYDFGVNLSGNVEICVTGLRGGKVRVVYSERADENGCIDRTNISEHVHFERFQQDEYILSGDGEETWRGEFSYHGFRYALISCENARIVSVKALCFHTDLAEAGSFAIDHPLVTRLQSAVLRCTRTNYHHMPTDCPHREKNGWTGDAALSCEQALFNFDMRDAYVKWLDDLIDAQRPSGEIPCIAPGTRWGYNGCNGPTWDVALFELPWQTYLFTGDRSVLSQCVDAMRRYLVHLNSTSDGNVWRLGLGDWCPPKNARICSTEALLTAYAWRAFDIYSKAAAALDLRAEAESARNRANEIRASIQKNFIGKEPDTQTFLALLLAFDLSDEPKEELIARLEETLRRADYHIECGIFGVKHLFNALTDNGRFDLAWKLLNADGYPGWSDMLERCPSTLSENWRSSSSQNHHMYSSIGDWFYKGIAGIHLDEQNPGFRRVFLHPHIPDDCRFFRAEHKTPLGALSVQWKDGRLSIVLPEGASAILTWRDAQIELPSGSHIL